MAEDNGSGIGWFLMGLGLGAAIGVLFAPKPGSETRDYVMHKANEGTDFVSQHARESFDEWIERGKEFVERQMDQVSTAVDSAKQAYREKTQSRGV